MKKAIYLTSEEAEIIAFLIEEELRANEIMLKDMIAWGINKEELEKLLIKLNNLI